MKTLEFPQNHTIFVFCPSICTKIYNILKMNDTVHIILIKKWVTQIYHYITKYKMRLQISKKTQNMGISSLIRCS